MCSLFNVSASNSDNIAWQKVWCTPCCVLFQRANSHQILCVKITLIFTFKQCNGKTMPVPCKVGSKSQPIRVSKPHKLERSYLNCSSLSQRKESKETKWAKKRSERRVQRILDFKTAYMWTLRFKLRPPFETETAKGDWKGSRNGLHLVSNIKFPTLLEPNSRLPDLSWDVNNYRVFEKSYDRWSNGDPLVCSTICGC